MKNQTNIFGKNSIAAKLVTAIVLVSIIIPNAFLISIPTVLAQGIQELAKSHTTDASASDSLDSVDSSSSSSDSSSDESSSESASASDTAAPAVSQSEVMGPPTPPAPTETPASEGSETAPTAANETTPVVTEITPDETPVVVADEPATISPDATDTNTDSSGGGSAANTDGERVSNVTSNPGVIRICTMFVDSNNNIMTSNAGLPAGTFQVGLTDAVGNPIARSSISAHAFIPNAHIIESTDDAICETVYNLPVDNSTDGTYAGYTYTPSEFSVGVPGYWKETKYNDQSDTQVTSTNDFYELSSTNGNSDGFISLSPSRPSRTLVVLHMFADVPLPCVAGSELDQDQFFNAIYSGYITRDAITFSNTNGAGGVATFHMTNTTGCTAPISLASYKMFDNVVVHQQLFEKTDVVLATSSTSITVNLPDCKAQVDAFTGPAASEFVTGATYLYPENPFILAAGISGGSFCGTTPPPPAACAVPNALGDVTPETIRTNTNNETTLQSILTNNGYAINAVADQQNYQIWNASENAVTMNATFIDGVSALNGTFGYYLADTGIASFVPLFSTGSNRLYPTVGTINRGQNMSFTVPADEKIGFALASEASGGNVYFSITENALTMSDTDTVVTYNAGNNSYILGFEDNTSDTSDFDYNDVVIDLRITDCGNGPTGPSNSAPVLTLLGDNPMNIIVGSTFTDPGATATDTEDGDLTSQISKTGEVDANTIGTYTITYTVSDSQGLTDTETRVVNVVAEDTTDTRGGGGGRSGGGGRRSSGGQILGAETGPTACIYLNDHLRRDWDNDTIEVLKLQYFLRDLEGFSTLNATGVFDDATFDAVESFQNRYFGDILAPWGHTAPTGFVYILSKKKVNEIFCRSAFPVTALEAQEIASFKAFMENLKSAGIDVSSDSMTAPAGSDMSDETMTVPEDGLVGSLVSTSTMAKINRDRIDLGNIKQVAAAVFSIPKDKGMILQSLYFLLIALIAVYLFTEIIVGSRDTSRLSKYQIWARKATGYTIGLILATIAAIWYQVFSIVVPLLVLAIVSAVFLAWSLSKKSQVDEAIILPPRN